MKKFSALVWFGLLAGVMGTSLNVALAETQRYELYSWKEETEWIYSLQPASTNDKAPSDIKSGSLRGISKVKEKLIDLQEGDSIVWKVRSENGTELPPPETVDELRVYAKSVGVKVTLNSTRDRR